MISLTGVSYRYYAEPYDQGWRLFYGELKSGEAETVLSGLSRHQAERAARTLNRHRRRIASDKDATTGIEGKPNV